MFSKKKTIFLTVSIFIILVVIWAAFLKKNTSISNQISQTSQPSINGNKIIGNETINDKNIKDKKNTEEQLLDNVEKNTEINNVVDKSYTASNYLNLIEKKVVSAYIAPKNNTSTKTETEATSSDINPQENTSTELEQEDTNSSTTLPNEDKPTTSEVNVPPIVNVRPEALNIDLGNNNSINLNSLTQEVNFGDEIIKEITVENTKSNDVYASINWHNLVNTYSIGSLVYSIYDEENNVLLDNVYVPYSETASTKSIINNLLIKKDESKNYTLKITYINNNRNQSKDQNANFYSEFNIEENNENNNELLLNKYNHSIYAWSTNMLKTSNRDSIITDLKNIGITDIYLGAFLNNDDLPLINKLNQEGFDVYLLRGDPSWYNNESIYKNYIDEIHNFNEAHGNIVKGIVFDVEPYGDNTYNSDVLIGFETYVNVIKTAYNYSRDKNVKIVNAIPVTYDLYYKDNNYNESEKARFRTAFEDLIKYSDRISLMNYFRGTMYENITDELALAKLNNVEIESIIEFGNVGDYISVYNSSDPFKESINEWSNILLNNTYDELSFSYHHLDVLLTLENKYKTYSFKFVNSNDEEINSGRYDLRYDGNKIVNYLNSPTVIPNDTIFSIKLEDYTGELSLVSEVEVDSHTITRTYRVDESTLRVCVPTVTYVALWNGSIYTGLLSNGKKVKLIDTYSLEETIYDVQGSDYAGYFIRANIYEDTYYNVEVLNENNNVIFNKVDKYEYNGDQYSEQNNTFMVSKGTPYTDVVYIGLYINN